MKNILQFVIIMLMGLPAVTQTYFSERYNYGAPLSLDYSQDIFQTTDGYIIPGGFIYRDSILHRIGIVKTDPLGNEVLIKTIGVGDDVYGYDMAYYQDCFHANLDTSGYYCVGMKRRYNVPNTVGVADYGLIFKFDLNLDTLWTVSIGDREGTIDSNFIFKHCDLLPDNGLIITGMMIVDGTSSKALLIKTDSMGNELWRKYFSNGPLNDGINVIATPDGGFALSVWKWVFGPQPVSTPFLVKTDSDGNEQWRKYFGGIWHDGPMYLVNAPDSTILGGYYYTDTMNYDITYCRDAIVKLSLDGSLQWEKKFGKSTYEKTTSSINVNNEGKIILAGYNYNPFPHRVGYLLNVSSYGDSLWYREYEEVWGVNSHNYLYGVIPTDDGGYAAAGMVHPNGNQDLWVLKVDSLGCESFDYCWTSLPGVISVEKPGELQVFPNPATGSCTVAIPKENQFETYTLVIYNLMGKKTEEVVVPSGETQVVLNLSGDVPGLYSVVTSYKGSITGRGKFVVY